MNKNFHVVESHIHLIGDSYLFFKAKRIGHRVYLLGERAGVALLGLYIAVADTNGYINKVAHFPEIKPDFHRIKSLDAFSLDNEEIGIATNNQGALEIFKIPGDLNITSFTVQSYLIIPDGYEDGYNMMGLDVSDVGRWLVFTYEGNDSIEMKLVKFSFSSYLGLDFSPRWKFPYSANFSIENAEPVSWISGPGLGGMITYENKMFGYMETSGLPVIWSSKMLPDNYSILNFDQNTENGFVINALNKDDNRFYLATVTPDRADAVIYKNGVIQKSVLRGDSLLGYTERHPSQTEIEKFKLSEVAICHDFVEDFEIEDLNILIKIGSDSLIQINRDVQFPAIPGWESYTVELDYLCDPNHLSLTENDFTGLSIFPNPASEFLNIETHEIIEQVTILDLTGKVIWVQLQPTGPIKIDDLKDGMYLLNIQSDKKNEVRKFVVKH